MKMLEMGVIQSSKSPWRRPLWLVEKRSGEYIVCFDRRKLNDVTVSDQYPMLLISQTSLFPNTFRKMFPLKDSFCNES